MIQAGKLQGEEDSRQGEQMCEVPMAGGWRLRRAEHTGVYREGRGQTAEVQEAKLRVLGCILSRISSRRDWGPGLCCTRGGKAHCFLERVLGGKTRARVVSNYTPRTLPYFPTSGLTWGPSSHSKDTLLLPGQQE